jgi:GTP-binding protein
MDEFTPAQIEEARKIFAGECTFLWGSADLNALPPPDKNEIAFAGRSNVGKSSLVNALTGRKTLAKISNTPGRTQQLNFFNLADHLYLVDMPGYGYAKVSKKMRAEWDKLIFNYLQGRPNLRTVLVMIDCRHGLKDVDLHLMDLLDKAAVNYRIVLTKCDKISEKERTAVSEQIRETLLKHPAAYPIISATSSENGIGIPELRAMIISLRG